MKFPLCFMHNPSSRYPLIISSLKLPNKIIARLSIPYILSFIKDQILQIYFKPALIILTFIMVIVILFCHQAVFADHSHFPIIRLKFISIFSVYLPYFMTLNPQKIHPCRIFRKISYCLFCSFSSSNSRFLASNIRSIAPAGSIV